MTTLARLIQRLGPLILSGAPVVVAMRKLLDDSAKAGYEARVANLEKAMELQSALNESIDAQLKIVQVLLKRVQRSLKILVVSVIGTAIIAVTALVLVVLNG
jgi:tetrahydromethanopterin S-methyltransferase subunit G